MLNYSENNATFKAYVRTYNKSRQRLEEFVNDPTSVGNTNECATHIERVEVDFYLMLTYAQKYEQSWTVSNKAPMLEEQKFIIQVRNKLAMPTEYSSLVEKALAPASSSSQGGTVTLFVDREAMLTSYTKMMGDNLTHLIDHAIGTIGATLARLNTLFSRVTDDVIRERINEIKQTDPPLNTDEQEMIADIEKMLAGNAAVSHPNPDEKAALTAFFGSTGPSSS